MITQEQVRKMNEDERHSWLDMVLEEMCFNLDITNQDDGNSVLEKLRAAILPIELTEEQWITYGAYCLRSSFEKELNKKAPPRIQ